jgi:hypothetical protein
MVLIGGARCAVRETPCDDRGRTPCAPYKGSDEVKIGGMSVQTAEEGDYGAWLRLAREVQDLFGPLVGEEAFQAHAVRPYRYWRVNGEY